MRAVLKSAAASGLHWSGAALLLGRLTGRARSPLVICYHRVVEDVRAHPRSAPAMLTSVSMLERQLDWIGRRYRFASLDEVAAQLEEPTGPRFDRRPLAAVTFDDGYADVYHNALPVLWRKGIPAACFVITGAVDGELPRLQHDELYTELQRVHAAVGGERLIAMLRRLGAPLGDPREIGHRATARQVVELVERLLVRCPRQQVGDLIASLRRESGGCDEESSGVAEQDGLMSGAMLREISGLGFTIGSHTRSHRVLPLERVEIAAAELFESRRRLEQLLGVQVSHLAYPNGLFCPATVRAAARAGYRYAYTTCVHRDPELPLLTIPRRCFSERSAAGAFRSFFPPVAACEVQGVFDLLRECRHHGPRPSTLRADPHPLQARAGRRVAERRLPAAAAIHRSGAPHLSAAWSECASGGGDGDGR